MDEISKYYGAYWKNGIGTMSPGDHHARLHIAVVSHTFTPCGGGGMESATFELVTALCEWAKITLITSMGTFNPAAPISVIRLPAIPCQRFLLNQITFQLSWYLFRTFSRHLRHFDVILSTSPLFAGGHFAVVHFCSSHYGKMLNRIVPPPLFSRQRLKHDYHRAMHTIAGWQEQRVFDRVKHGTCPTIFLPVSQGLLRVLTKEFNLPPEKMIYIPNPVNLARFSPGCSPDFEQELRERRGWTAKNHILLLFAGSGWERKGLAHAFDALTHLPENVKLVVAGIGNTDSYLIEAKKKAIEHRVLFLGFRRDMEKIYRTCHALILPSIFEALPMACLESLACGRPILVFPFPGSETLVAEGENGFVVADARQLALRAADLMDPQQYARMCHNARESASRFDKKNIARALMTLFQSVRRCEAGI